MSNSHNSRKHALLSASGSYRWLNCSPSARLEEEYGESKSSPYAREGTIAHELAELMIERDILENIEEAEFTAALEDLMNDEHFNEDMFEEVPKYVEYCAEQFNEAKTRTPDAVMNIEQKVNFSEYVPDGFGTDDCIIIADGLMEIIDLKYGKGVPVYATYNTQLMLYGLGALRKYSMAYDITTVRLTVMQPRLDNISSWDISVDDLMAWAEGELKEKAQIAFAGEGTTNPGDWCKFCSVKNRCRGFTEENLKIARHEFSNPNILTDEEVAEIIGISSRLSEWANSVKDYATMKSMNDGKIWPGYKLVEGISRRRWTKEDKVVEAIRKNLPGMEEDDFYNYKLKSITDIEKLVGKKLFNEKLGDVVIKPSGKPTLVSEDDKRPAIGIEQAIKDFS